MSNKLIRSLRDEIFDEEKRTEKALETGREERRARKDTDEKYEALQECYKEKQDECVRLRARAEKAERKARDATKERDLARVEKEKALEIGSSERKRRKRAVAERDEALAASSKSSKSVKKRKSSKKSKKNKSAKKKKMSKGNAKFLKKLSTLISQNDGEISSSSESDISSAESSDSD